MQSHVFNSDPDPSLSATNGVVTLNLVGGSWGTSHLPLANVEKASGVRSAYSHAFSSYYLKYEENKAPTLQLGTAANYFFTAALTGCRLIISGGGQPMMTHVDGGAFDDGQLNQMCSVRADGRNIGGKRYWDNGSDYAAVVVGVRANAGWTFYTQLFNYDSTLPIAVQQI